MNSAFYTEKLSGSLKNPKIAIGPSALVLFAEDGELTDNLRPIVPANLLRLAAAIKRGSKDHQLFLLKVIRHYHPRWHAKSKVAVLDDIKKLAEKLLSMKENHQLDIIDKTNKTDEKIEMALSELYPDHAFEIALSPKRNFLRDYLIAIYSWAKNTGSAILEASEKVFSDVGRYLSALQLPDRVGKYLIRKKEILGEVARTRKIFLAIILILTPDPTTLCVVFTDP